MLVLILWRYIAKFIWFRH